MADFRLWWQSGFGSELLPIIPPGVTLSPNSTVRPQDRGKTPGTYDAVQKHWQGLTGKWPANLRPETPDLKRWQASGASVGMQTRAFNACDIDVDDDATARAIEELALDILGPVPVRFREGSPRRLLLYRLKDGETPLRKRRLAWKVGTEEPTHALEWLAYGQQCVVEGPHPKGGAYAWRAPRPGMGNSHPCDGRGSEGLAEITGAHVDRFFAAVADMLDLYGFTLVTNHSTKASGTRKALSDTALHAPSAALVMGALAAVPCNAETFNTRDAFVAFLVAVKAALGSEADDHWPAVLEWALQYPGSEEAYISKIWDSVHDAELGWEWLAGFARGYGYSGDAQADFDDGDAAPAERDPNAGIPDTAIERMLARYVYVQKLGQYNDTADGSFLTSKDFNAANVHIAHFGRSGVQSAEAEFQNNPLARKVAVPTSKPGEPVITTATNEYGVAVHAVNLWRGSNVQPNPVATATNVTPWLDLVEKLFGPEGAPEREHFLDWWAFVLQRPGGKIGHALVIIGGQGVGKDTVLKPLFEAVGLHNVASIDTATLCSQWTYFLKSQIVYCQEMITYGRRDLYNSLKPFISAQATRLAVNEKGLRQFFVPNNQNWVVTTNHDNAIALEDDDRRFWVHQVLLDEPPAGDYFTRLHAWFQTGGTENVFGWLRQRKIAAFDPMARPPMTTAKRTMVDQSQPAPIRWLRGLFVDGGAFAGRAIVIASELLKVADQDFSAPQGINHKHVAPALKSEGFKLAHRVRIGGGVRQLWVRDPSGTLSRLSPDAIRERYLSEASRGRNVGEAA